MASRLIPVTRTEAKYPEGLPGLPYGKAAQVIAATPDGHEPTVDGRRWLDAVLASPEFTAARRDQQRTLTACAEFLAVALRFRHGILRPGLAQIRTAIGDVSERTAYRALQWLREHHWIAHVQRGSTERYRGAQDGRGNLAAEFILLTPRPPTHPTKNVSPSRFPSGNGKNSLSRTCEANHNSKSEPLRGHHQGPADAGKNNRGLDERAAWPSGRSPRTGLERLRATQSLQQQLPDLRRLTDLHLRSLLRPWYEAGWSNHDVHYALDHTPDARTRTYGGGSHDVRSPQGWVLSRLAPWATFAADGTWWPTDSPTTRRARQADAERERAAAATAAVRPDHHNTAAQVIRAAAKNTLAAILAANRRARTTPADIPVPLLPPTPRAWRTR